MSNGPKDIGERRAQDASQLLRNLGFFLDPKAMEMIPMDATVTAVSVESVPMPPEGYMGTQATIRFTRSGGDRHRLDLTMNPAEHGTHFKLRRDNDR